jgi:SAM-dependent methyltransferase
MRNNAMRVLALIVLPIVWLPTARSAQPPVPSINEEMTKQERIYRSEGQKMPDVYKTDRSLSEYTRALSSEFDRTLANLGPNDRWLDIGAGKGQAILDYYDPTYDLQHWEGRGRRGKKARAVAISIEDARTPLWRTNAASLEADQIQYLHDRRLREYSAQELGQFDVITDVIGGFSYTDNLSVFMEKVLGFLEVGGSFYTLLQDVHSEAGTNRPFYAGAPFLTEIAKADGSEVKVCSWLKTITCVTVTCELRADWKPPIEAFHVKKVCDQVSVPALVPVHYQAGTPPERRFQLKN